MCRARFADDTSDSYADSRRVTTKKRSEPYAIGELARVCNSERKMKYGIETKDRQFEFVGEMTMSIGSGMTLDSRYGHDASNRPQALTRRKRRQARTATVNVTIGRAHVRNIFDEVQKYEALAGAVGELTWAAQDLGLWCVRDVSFSFGIDAIDIAASVQVSMSLSEGYVRPESTAKQADTFRLL